MSAAPFQALEARLRQRKGIVPYLTAGDGGLEHLVDLLQACEQAGSVAVELGIPFSDPMADGPVLQAAAHRALEGGAALEPILESLARFRANSDLPVFLFSYANPLVSRGLERSARMAREAGAQGVLIPDLPVEEAAMVRSAMTKEGLATVLFCAPTTRAERLRQAVNETEGFLYAIGRFGVTGAGTEIDEGVQGFLREVMAQATTPVGVGFGLRRADQVAQVLEIADLAIVGSALVQHLHESQHKARACEAFLKQLGSMSPGASP